MRSLTAIVTSVIKSMANLIMQPFQVATQLGANNISVQMTTGKTKLLDAQVAAPQKPKRKQSAVQSTKRASSRKQTQKVAQQERGQALSQLATPASKTPQPVKPARKAKAKPAQSTKAERLSQLEQAVAQIRTVAQSGEHGKRKTTAPKILQPAKVVQTLKLKVADSTIPAKKHTTKQIPVQTRTARPSKVRGT